MGNAVIRNQVRRRLRSALTDLESELEPGVAYLVGATPDAAGASYEDLARAVGVCVRDGA